MSSVICVPACLNPGTIDVPDPNGPEFDTYVPGTRDTFTYDRWWPMYQGKPDELDPDGVPFHTYRKGQPGATVARIDGGFDNRSCLWYRFSATATDDHLRGYAWAYSSLYRFISYSTRMGRSFFEVALEAQDMSEECKVRAPLVQPINESTGQTFTQIVGSVLPNAMAWVDEVDISLTMQAFVSGGSPSAAVGAGPVSFNVPAPAEGMNVAMPLNPARSWRAKAGPQTISPSGLIAPPGGQTARIQAPVSALATIATATAGLVALALAIRPA